MIGDSIMRYQYLSLAYYLRNGGEWWNSSIREGQLVNERQFKTWEEFYRVVSTEYLSPYESCDCFRSQRGDGFDLTTENRYFYDKDDNFVVYLQSFGTRLPTRGQWNASDLANFTASQERASPRPLSNFKDPASNWTWSFENWKDIVLEHIATLQPKITHLVVSQGWWYSPFMSKDNRHVEERRREFVSALAKANIVGIWRTTTYNSVHELKGDWQSDTDTAMCQLLDHCLNASWTRHLDPKHYWNNLHFWEPVYQLLNQDLLAMLEQLPDGYKQFDRTQYFDKAIME
jgi:hypothetical protein